MIVEYLVADSQQPPGCSFYPVTLESVEEYLLASTDLRKTSFVFEERYPLRPFTPLIVENVIDITRAVAPRAKTVQDFTSTKPHRLPYLIIQRAVTSRTLA